MLRDLQRDLARAFLDRGVGGESARRVLAALRPVGRATPEDGLRVYQSALRRVREEALRRIFPVCAELVGERCFRSIADAHAAARASHHADLGRLGDTFPDLLPTLAFLDEVPYLADVARLELALHDAADAAGPTSTPDPEAVACALGETPSRYRLVLAPSVRLLASRFAIAALWRAHREVPRESTRWPCPEARGVERLVVWRGKDGLEVETAPSPLWSVLLAVDAGRSVQQLLDLGVSVGETTSKAIVEDSASEYAPALALIERLFARGWVTGVARIGDDPERAAPSDTQGFSR